MLALLAHFAFFFPSPALATPQEESLESLSLEQLGNVPAIVSSKFPDRLFDVPTGSFIFCSDDIERLPADSIPELLRYAPGTHIIRPSNGIWGVGIRGINSRFFNRVQFTVDEQNVYGTIFAGLFGNQHDLLLEDVASIEVAYGPGGGTWDNNAVNGMVNVLMKTAFETEGTLLQATVGTESRSLSARVGWAIDDTTSARVYLKGGVRDSSHTRFDYSNKWDTGRAGFRLDKRLSSRDLVSISGEAYYSYLGYAYNLADFATGDLEFKSDPEMLRGASTQIKWIRNNADKSTYSVRSWITYSDLDAAYAAFGMGTAGAEARGRVMVSDSHTLNLNLGGAYDQEHTRTAPAADWTNDFVKNFSLYSGFQDEWTIIQDKLDISWGIDVRYEDKSDITTTSPNTRLIYQLSDTDRIWMSYSQAERTTPVSLSVIESLRSGKEIDPVIPIPTPFGEIALDRSLTDASSTVELDSETLDAFEVGYRRQFDKNKGSFFINGYLYRYDNIFARIGESASPELFVNNPFLNIQGSYDNLLEGEAYGFEAYLNWHFSDAVEAKISYSRLVDAFDPLISSTDPFVAQSIQFSLDEFDNSTPGHLATFNLSADLNDQWNLDTGLRFSDSYDFAKGYQPSILQLDARLTWAVSRTLQCSLVGRNLLEDRVREARLKDFFGHWTEMKREIFLEIKADF